MQDCLHYEKAVEKGDLEQLEAAVGSSSVPSMSLSTPHMKYLNEVTTSCFSDAFRFNVLTDWVIAQFGNYQSAWHKLDSLQDRDHANITRQVAVIRHTTLELLQPPPKGAPMQLWLPILVKVCPIFQLPYWPNRAVQAIPLMENSDRYGLAFSRNDVLRLMKALHTLQLSPYRDGWLSAYRTPSDSHPRTATSKSAADRDLASLRLALTRNLSKAILSHSVPVSYQSDVRASTIDSNRPNRATSSIFS